MDRVQAAGEAGLNSDALLAAYQLLIETTLETCTDEVLLERALAVVVAIPWPASHRHFSASLLSPDGSPMRLAASATGSAAPAPPCADATAASCFCGRALIQQGRLHCISAASEALRPACDPDGTGTHLILPLAARGRIWGVLHAVIEPGLLPGRLEQTFLMQVAALLGAELQRRQNEREHDRLELQFLQAQKMEAVGRLAGGVAHDFNNILTAITNYADLGLLKLPAPNPLRRNFEEIIAAADRAALLTQQLLAFSRRQILAPRVIDVGALLAELAKSLRRLLGTAVELTIETGSGPARITADPALIEQLIINLALSARDALPRGGAIAFATSCTEFDATYTVRHPTVAPGAYVCLELSAHGPGMLTSHMDALIVQAAPPPAPQTGVALGPAAIGDIIRQSGGHAQVGLSPDAVSTVRVFFPAVGAGAAAAPATAEAYHLPRGSETILLAEDDDSVRVVMGEVLRDLGYQVLEAREGREALGIASSVAPGIDIVLTDVVLPGISGGELVSRLRVARPGLRVLYLAGVMDEMTVQLGGAGPDALYIQKPFSPWSLATRLRQVLDAPPPTQS